MLLSILLTYYAIGCRFFEKQWPRELNELKGVLFTGFVQWLIIIAGCGWLQVLVRWSALFDLGRSAVMLLGAALLTGNYILIVKSGKGPAYVREFARVPQHVRTARYAACLISIVVIVALIVLSIVAYRRTFGVPE